MFLIIVNNVLELHLQLVVNYIFHTLLKILRLVDPDKCLSSQL